MHNAQSHLFWIFFFSWNWTKKNWLHTTTRSVLNNDNNNNWRRRKINSLYFRWITRKNWLNKLFLSYWAEFKQINVIKTNNWYNIRYIPIENFVERMRAWMCSAYTFLYLRLTGLRYNLQLFVLSVLLRRFNVDRSCVIVKQRKNSLLLFIQHMCTLPTYNRCCECSVKLLAHTCKKRGKFRTWSLDVATVWSFHKLYERNSIKTLGNFNKISLLYFVNIILNFYLGIFWNWMCR